MTVYKCLNDNVLIRRFATEEKTTSGFVIPKQAQEKRMRGVVVAVGDGLEFQNGTKRPLKVKEGDEVLFRKFAGVELPEGSIDGSKDWLLVLESDIMMVYEKD